MSLEAVFILIVFALFVAAVAWVTVVNLRQKASARQSIRELCGHLGWRSECRAPSWHLLNRIFVWPLPSSDPLSIRWVFSGSFATQRTCLAGFASFSCSFRAYPAPVARLGSYADPGAPPPSYVFAPSDPSVIGSIPGARFSELFGMLAPIICYRRGRLTAEVPYLVTEPGELARLLQSFEQLRQSLGRLSKNEPASEIWGSR